jgi:hypothetical protein
MPTPTPNHLPRKLHPCTWMKEDEEFFHLGTDEPFLVLYTLANRKSLEDFHGEFSTGFVKRPAFKKPNEWVNIMHQTAGYACHSYYIHAKFLKPKNYIKEDLYNELLEKYNDSCISRIPRLKTAWEYETLLNKYDLTANESYQYLEEGFYPIDIECLKKVTNEKFPKDLQDLIKKSKEKQKLWSFLNYVHFGIAILGPNCD